MNSVLLRVEYKKLAAMEEQANCEIRFLPCLWPLFLGFHLQTSLIHSEHVGKRHHGSLFPAGFEYPQKRKYRYL